MEHLDIIFERYEIATSRIREIINEDTVSEPFKSFFCKASEFICKIDDLNSIIKSGEINDFSLDRLKELNKSLFEEIYSENYEESFANPEYAVKTLGEEYGKILCYIYTKNRGMIRNVYMGSGGCWLGVDLGGVVGICGFGGLGVWWILFGGVGVGGCLGGGSGFCVVLCCVVEVMG